MPDLHDVALNLTSAFATAKGGGKSLDALDIPGNIDLAKLNAQLAQFVDLSGKSFAGTRRSSTSVRTGNLTADGGRSDLEAEQLTLKQRHGGAYGLARQGRLDSAAYRATDATATLMRGVNAADGFIGAVSKAKVTFQSSDGQAAVIDLLATAKNIKLADAKEGGMGVENFNVEKFTIDLPRAQQQFAAFIPPGFKASSGTINATITGSCVNRLMQFDEKAQIQNVTLQAVDKQNVAHSVITGESEDIAVAGTFQATPDKTKATINLTGLSASSSNKLFNIAKSPEQPLEITLHDSGKTTAIAGNGQLTVTSDLKGVMDLVQSLSNTATPAPGAPGQLTSGNFSATLKLAQTDQGGTRSRRRRRHPIICR